MNPRLQGSRTSSRAALLFEHEAISRAVQTTWWGRDRRWSLRGRSSKRHAWTEPDLRGFPSWDSRQRRNAGLGVVGVITFGFVTVTMLGSGG